MTVLSLSLYHTINMTAYIACIDIDARRIPQIIEFSCSFALIWFIKVHANRWLKKKKTVFKVFASFFFIKHYY